VWGVSVGYILGVLATTNIVEAKPKKRTMGEKKIKPNPAVVFTDLEDGSAVLRDLDSKLYYSLNETGCFMWRVFEDRGDVNAASLVNMLVSEYEVGESDAARDVEDFVSSLAKEGLIQLH
jgi:hypothetical protein